MNHKQVGCRKKYSLDTVILRNTAQPWFIPFALVLGEPRVVTDQKVVASLTDLGGCDPVTRGPSNSDSAENLSGFFSPGCRCQALFAGSKGSRPLAGVQGSE